MFGITQKTDGKSSTFSSSTFRSSTFEKAKDKTQGEKDESYEPNAQNDEDRRGETDADQKWMKIFGAIVVFAIAMAILSGSGDKTGNIVSDQFVRQRGIRTEEDNRTIFKDA